MVASVSLTIHSQAKGSVQKLPSREGVSSPFSPETKPCWFYQILVCPFHHLHGYQLSPNQGHLKHKLDNVTHLLNVPSIAAMASQLTQ